MNYLKLRKQAKGLIHLQQNYQLLLSSINSLIQKGTDISTNSKAIEIIRLTNEGIQQDIKDNIYTLEELPFDKVHDLSDTKRILIFYKRLWITKFNTLKLPWYLRIFIYSMPIGELLILGFIIVIVFEIKIHCQI